MARIATIAVLIALAAVPVLAAAFDAPFYLDLFGRVMIYAIAALSLNLVMGYGGMVSFGHAAFLGLGGYAVGILAKEGIESGFVQWPLAVGSCALFAFLTGLVVLRTSGAYFIMITLAFAQMLFFLFTSLAEYGGDDGLTIWTRSEFSGLIDLNDGTSFYYLVFILLLLCLGISARLVDSRFGMVLRGAKANERRMRAIGFPTFRYKLAAYTISGAMCGLAGALLANQAEFVGPSVLHWSRSGEILVMVVLGGMGGVAGPVLGAAAYLLLSYFLADLTKHWAIIMGPLLILVVLYARGGLLGLLGGRRARAGSP